jgi:hypothetical protein
MECAKSMINRRNKVRRWLLLLGAAFFVLLLPGRSAHPEPSAMSAFEASAPPSMAAQVPSAGSVERGRDLFLGYVHFQRGGPPCMGCHNIGSNGLLGGGALGPDLTNVTTRRRPSELTAILSNWGTISMPVMDPIYAGHPLTSKEQADLLAFMRASAGQPETNREWWVVGISLAGFLGAVGLIELVYHRRLRGVRKRLVRTTQS